MRPKPLKRNQREAFELIKSFVGQANILTIPRVFLDYTGSLDCALFLSQVIYWSDRNPHSEWFYKTYKDWQEELGLSEYQVRRCTNILKGLDLLETKLKKANGSPTVHYRFKVHEFSDWILKKLQKRTLKNSRNLNRDYTETKGQGFYHTRIDTGRFFEAQEGLMLDEDAVRTRVG